MENPDTSGWRADEHTDSIVPVQRPKSMHETGARNWSWPTPPRDSAAQRRSFMAASASNGHIFSESDLSGEDIPTLQATPRLLGNDQAAGLYACPEGAPHGTKYTSPAEETDERSMGPSAALRQLTGADDHLPNNPSVANRSADVIKPVYSERWPTLHRSRRPESDTFRRNPTESEARHVTGSASQRPGNRPRSLPCSPTSLLYRRESSTFNMSPSPGVPEHMQPEGGAWPLPPLPRPATSAGLSKSPYTDEALGPKPKPSLSKLSSLDQLITYREERAEWRRKSLSARSTESQRLNIPFERSQAPLPGYDEPTIALNELDVAAAAAVKRKEHKYGTEMPISGHSTPGWSASPPPSTVVIMQMPLQESRSKFRHWAAEIGFCFTIAITQVLAEYMISGFAIELPRIMRSGNGGSGSSSSSDQADNAADGLGTFWPASLLSLILSAMLLTFARISDLHGGYFPFMFGVVWLGIWSLVAGFAGAGILLDVARAMHGLGIAAYIPSTFALVGSIYPEGPRKNFVLGLYSGCAPVGFLAGFLVASALPEGLAEWYFWIAAVLSFVAAMTAYLTVPSDRIDRKQFGLRMDWVGSFLITTGLILFSYSLVVEPYANQSDPSRSGWSDPRVLAPLIAGFSCLLAAFWVEGWWAACPLLPFDFFTPHSVKAFSLACLCFYASYGVWLYDSAQFFESESATGIKGGIQGLTLAAWYTPTAVGGLILCVASGTLLHVIPVMAMLFISALAWIGAPLILALCPLPVDYWAYVMPSMLCATLGIDLTFTVSVVFLSYVQPLRYQGLAGAVCSILVNLAMSFSLSISEIVSDTARSQIVLPDVSDPGYQAAADRRQNWGLQAAFVYATASAGVGLLISFSFVRIPRSVVQEKSVDEERPRSSFSTVSLVEAGHVQCYH